MSLLEEVHEVRRPRPTGAIRVGLLGQPERTAKVHVPASVGPRWLGEVVMRLERLRPGRSEEAVPEQVLVDALYALMQFLPADATAPAVAPTGNGGVQFEWHRGGWDVEVEFHDGDAHAWMENLGTGERWSGALTDRLDDLRATMRIVNSY